MAFIQNAEDVARREMLRINPKLAEKYAKLISFLAEHPDAAAGLRGKSAPSIGSEAYISRQATAFAEARRLHAPQAPATVPDDMVSVILHVHFGIPTDSLERAKQEHLLSMGAENFVGNLLERYLASIMEDVGWIWCSGSLVKAVDFVKPPSAVVGQWRLLQVKNRDNSENSSSSAIRDGTTIEKWHRTFSKRPGKNWAVFPDPALRHRLSESGFTDYVKNYLNGIKN